MASGPPPPQRKQKHPIESARGPPPSFCSSREAPTAQRKGDVPLYPTHRSSLFSLPRPLWLYVLEYDGVDHRSDGLVEVPFNEILSLLLHVRHGVDAAHVANVVLVQALRNEGFRLLGQ